MTCHEFSKMMHQPVARARRVVTTVLVDDEHLLVLEPKTAMSISGAHTQEQRRGRFSTSQLPVVDVTYQPMKFPFAHVAMTAAAACSTMSTMISVICRSLVTTMTRVAVWIAQPTPVVDDRASNSVSRHWVRAPSAGAERSSVPI